MMESWPKTVSAAVIMFNILLLVKSHGAFPCESSCPSVNFSTAAFLERLQKNGVDGLELIDLIFMACIMLLVNEILYTIVMAAARALNLKQIPVRGKHLDDLEPIDVAFITFQKISALPFAYFLAKHLFHEPNVIWPLQSVSFTNTLLAIPPFFIIFDFFYTIFHWALHIQSVYGYIHKYHHRQKAPTRGNADAGNVHPVELLLGQYNHIFTVYIYCNLLGMQMHVIAINIILIMVIFLSTLNHTRFDSKVEIVGVTLYDSKCHDVHHRIPQSNYGQYIHIWDKMFGTFRMYDPNDRVNPSHQVDPKTGKSLNYGKMKGN
jgi:sterol desaturase/sphingolipid hydroxylase (fatty acid hydroxylase superfamily)